jgi:CBS domain-containing protein
LRGIPIIGVIFGYLAITNALLAIFNLIPGFPLDGGRVLRAILWKLTGNLRTATRWATRVGQAIALLFILAGIWTFFTGNFLDGLWLGFIGWFLFSIAQAANANVMLDSLFGRVTVGEVMNPNPLTVPHHISLLELVESYLLPRAVRAAPVTAGEQLLGLVSLTDIRQIPREQWAQTPIWQVMVPRNRLIVTSPQQRLSEALRLMVRHNIHQVPVVQDERLVGMMSRETIMRFLEVRRGLGLQETQEVEETLRKDQANRAADSFVCGEACYAVICWQSESDDRSATCSCHLAGALPPAPDRLRFYQQRRRSTHVSCLRLHCRQGCASAPREERGHGQRERECGNPVLDCARRSRECGRRASASSQGRRPASSPGRRPCLRRWHRRNPSSGVR